MKQLLFFSLAISVMFLYACEEKSGGNNTNDSTGKLGLSSASQQSPPFELVPRDSALRWIKNYDSLVLTLGRDSLVSRISLAEGHNNFFLGKAKKIKFLLATRTGSARYVTVLVQLKLKGATGGYEYYDLAKPTTVSTSDLESGFCPLPYPCSTAPIEEP